MKYPLILLAFMLCAAAYAHDIDHPAVKVRVTSFNAATDTYNFSCAVPASSPGSQISDRKFYAIDPVPQGHNRSYYSTDPYIIWDLDPTAYRELVHRKAIYHIYCEVQNYSAPSGQQNMASEFHVDLRTDDNKDVPDIYVLSSHGNELRMKCEPPNGVRNYDLSWSYRSRVGKVDLPHLKNQNIVNITLPYTGAGWDVVCSVFDKFTGKTSTWDMPLETFEGRVAYVPTIEGCITGEPCTWVDPSGTPPAGTFQLATSSGAAVYLNEAFKGNTSSNGSLTLTAPAGIYNLMIRKDGYEEISTLLPLAAGETISRTYTLQLPSPPPDQWNMCHTTIHSLPVNCTGTITEETVTGSCRVIACASGANGLKVQACNKQGFFEMYKQAQTGSGVKVCLGNTCMQNEGYIKSQNYPICLGNGTITNTTTNSTNSTNSSNTTQTKDLQALSIAGPSSATLSEYVTATISYKNNGNTAVQNAGEGFYLSTDAVITTADIPLLGAVGGPVNPGATFTTSRQMPISTDITPGTYYWGIIMDHENLQTETNETNNAMTGNIIVITNNSSNTSNSSNITCHTSAQSIPASCEGSTISSDTWNGGRTIICGTTRIQAWNKQGFFEMYKQAGGNAIKICIGATCIRDNGYAKSGNFPICIASNNTNTSACTPATEICNQQDDDCDSQIDEGNVCTPICTPATEICDQQDNDCDGQIDEDNICSTTCYSRVNDMPATCASGTIITDEKSGCRKIVCQSSSGSIQILACNKPDGNTPQYFEMYKQVSNGTAPRVCIGNTCMQNEGCMKSGAYPLCS
jgi:hypothetical protein